MQESFTYNLDKALLNCSAIYSDRFVYSQPYIPMELKIEDVKGSSPILSAYQRSNLSDLLPVLGLDRLRNIVDQLHWSEKVLNLPRQPDESMKNEYGHQAVNDITGDLKATLDKVQDHITVLGENAVFKDQESYKRLNDNTGKIKVALNRLISALSLDLDVPSDRYDPKRGRHAVLQASAAIRPLLSESEEYADKASAVGKVKGHESLKPLVSLFKAINLSLIDLGVCFEMMEYDPGGSKLSPRWATLKERLKLIPDEQMIDIVANLAKSEMGYLFLDRTRIRPNGFAIGEHIYSLSLTPGEELTIEQKTYSKREVTFEDQNEQESQFDLELSSVLSTELQEGMEQQQTETNKLGLGTGVKVDIPVKGVNITPNLDISADVTDANTRTSRRSLKNSTTASAKIAAKYRSVHKTVFKIATEDRFEATNKRVVKNPNKFTPIDLHYFKLLQVMEMQHERYGVRLCWSPYIIDPAFDLYERIRSEKQKILDSVANPAIPSRPAEPSKPDNPPREISSGLFEAKDWGLFNDMRADYTITITLPSTYVWDGDVDYVKNSLTVSTVNIGRKYHCDVVADPWCEGDDVNGYKVLLKVHVGCDATTDTCGHLYIEARARCVLSPATQDPIYAASYQEWLNALAEWQSRVAAIEAQSAQARADAQKKAEAVEKDMLASFNPLNELMNRVISLYFPPAVRDEGWEISLWGQLFDWSEAAFLLYPSWWSEKPMRDYAKDPNHFLNASWARLFLPVKPMFEHIALRWIYGRTIETPLDSKTEKAFTKVIDDLASYRKANFGDELETCMINDGTSMVYQDKYISLGKWVELLPTDGTHVEILQSISSAADGITQNEIEDARKLRLARVADEEEDVELKKKAVSQMTTPANADVNVHTGEIGLITNELRSGNGH